MNTAEPGPRPDQVATARRLRDLHRRCPDPFDLSCVWCLKPWPCPDERWSARVLHLAAETRR